MRRRLRPRFEIHRDETADVLLERVRVRLRSNDCAVSGYITADRVVVHVPAARQRFWSAELRVDAVQRGESTTLQGVYAPHPHVWVTYVIVLAAMAVGITAALVFALAEWSMHERPVALYALLPLLAIGAATYASAFVGQGFASDEMDELRIFLEEALEPAAPLHSHIRNLRPGDEAVSGSKRA